MSDPTTLILIIYSLIGASIFVIALVFPVVVRLVLKRPSSALKEMADNEVHRWVGTWLVVGLLWGPAVVIAVVAIAIEGFLIGMAKLYGVPR